MIGNGSLQVAQALHKTEPRGSKSRLKGSANRRYATQDTGMGGLWGLRGMLAPALQCICWACWAAGGWHLRDQLRPRAQVSVPTHQSKGAQAAFSASLTRASTYQRPKELFVLPQQARSPDLPAALCEITAPVHLGYQNHLIPSPSIRLTRTSAPHVSSKEQSISPS